MSLKDHFLSGHQKDGNAHLFGRIMVWLDHYFSSICELQVSNVDNDKSITIILSNRSFHINVDSFDSNQGAYACKVDACDERGVLDKTFEPVFMVRPDHDEDFSALFGLSMFYDLPAAEVVKLWRKKFYDLDYPEAPPKYEKMEALYQELRRRDLLVTNCMPVASVTACDLMIYRKEFPYETHLEYDSFDEDYVLSQRKPFKIVRNLFRSQNVMEIANKTEEFLGFKNM